LWNATNGTLMARVAAWRGGPQRRGLRDGYI